jgi:hypothetical protein
MTEPCARPGCGQPYLKHTVAGCYVCPAFRTLAQQEAWEDLRKAMSGEISLGDSPWVLIVDANKRLLKLYP